MRALTRQALTTEQRAYDPLTRGRHGRLGKLAIALGAVVAAVGAHVAVLVASHVLGTSATVLRRRLQQSVRVEMREPPPPPPVVEAKKPPPPAPKLAAPPPPKLAKAAPPPAPTPHPKAPVRVVGLSLESTTEGGNGPAFAVGETRGGETAPRAAEPRPTAPTETLPAGAPVRTNAAATRIPVAGINYSAPKPKGERRQPPYPELLKAQGIEGDVGVMVSIGADGNVTKVKIVTPAPYDEMNQAARATAEHQEWEPALRDGVAIPYTLSYTYRFRLEDQ